MEAEASRSSNSRPAWYKEQVSGQMVYTFNLGRQRQAALYIEGLLSVSLIKNSDKTDECHTYEHMFFFI